MTATLHHVPKTISSPIFQLLLELKLVPDTVVVKTLTFPELKERPHLDINPMGTSPAFHDGDIIIWESGAILTWLLEKYDVNHTFHPAPGDDDMKRAKFLHLQHYIIATVYPFLASLFVLTLKPKDEQDTEYVESAKNKWKNLMAPILVEWLGDGPYMLGESVSVIDFLLCKPLNNVKSLGMLDETPKLKAIFEEISNRHSFHKAYDVADHKMKRESRSMVLTPLSD